MKYDDESAKSYSERQLKGTTDYLVYRDIPNLIETYASGTKALDYGCGAGRSIQLLQEGGYDTMGVDVNASMLKQATKLTGAKCVQIVSGDLPFEDETFDLILSTLVFLEFPNLKEMKRALTQMHRVLKPSGTIIVATNSEQLPYGNWVNVKTDIDGELNSGDIIHNRILGTDLYFDDYFWKDSDYRKTFAESGFRILNTHEPLGRNDEHTEWKDETTTSPWTIYILCKLSTSQFKN